MARRLHLLIAALFAVMWSSSALAECSREDAEARMQVLQIFVSTLLSEVRRPDETRSAEASRKLSKFGTQLGRGQALLRDGKYDEACAVFEELADENGLVFRKSGMGMSVVSKTDETRCDTTEAARRAAELMQRFQEVYAGRTPEDMVVRLFLQELKPLEELMKSDVSKACAHIDDLQHRYNLTPSG